MRDLGCREMELSLGAFAVGALEPLDRAEVDSHLERCPRCRSTTAELQDVTDLMGLVSAGSAALAADGSALPRPTVPTPAPPARRRTRLLARTLAAAAAVAVILIVTGVAVSTWLGSDPVQAVRVQATDPGTGVAAAVTLTPVEVGTELRLRLTGVPRRATCQLVVVAADGRRTVAATWLATYAGTARVTGTTDLSRSEVSRLVVATPDGEVFVSVPVGT